MGRPPSNGAPSFRFNSAEVAQMEEILQKHEGQVPARDLLVALANRFSNSPERSGKMVVQMKQVWNWFQNRRYALRAKSVKSPDKPSPSPVTRDNVTPLRSAPPVPQQMPVTSGPHVVRNASETPQMEFEARSARDGAWYDVQLFLSHRNLESDTNPEVLVRFVGFGPEEDEWVNILKYVRQRSLPCEASECIVVTPGDLILCFQEGKEQALYFDAHVLDVQRRRHDVRGCRCRFLVRYDHDQSEEIVPLRKICRRPETDYRLHQLNAEAASGSISAEPPKPVVDSTISRMDNPGPSSAATANHSPPSLGAGPSALTPTPPSPTPPPPPPSLFVASSPAVAQTSVPTPTPATDISTATVLDTAVAPSDPAPVTAPVAPVPVNEPVTSAPLTESITASMVAEPVTPDVVTAPVSPAEVGEPIALAPIVAPVAPASVTAAIAPTPAAVSVKTEKNSAPVPEPMETDNVNAGMTVDKIAPQENVTDPAAGRETGPLTGTGDLSGNPTMEFPEPDFVASSIPGDDPSANGALEVEGGKTTTAPTANETNNVTVETEEIKA